MNSLWATRTGRPWLRREVLSYQHYQWRLHRAWEGLPTGPEEWAKVERHYIRQTTWPRQALKWAAYLLTLGGWRIYWERSDEDE